MKSITCCLILMLLFVLPTQCLAQSEQTSNTVDDLEVICVSLEENIPVKLTLLNGQTVKGKFNHWLKGSYIELSQRDSFHRIPLSEIKDIKADYNFSERVDRGISRVLSGALFVVSFAVVYTVGFAIAGVTRIAKGGKTRR